MDPRLIKVSFKLEKARANYYDYSGFIGFWKRSAHKVADNVDERKRLLSLLPSTEYSSVIHCVLDIVFDVSSEVLCLPISLDG